MRKESGPAGTCPDIDFTPYPIEEPGQSRLRLFQVLITLLPAALAIPLFLCAGPIYALLALSVAAVSFMVAGYYIGRIARANEQKCKLDLQLIQSQKLAAIGELSSGIAHEINNPLAIIGQEVEWMKHLMKEGGCGSNTPVGGMSEFNESLIEIGRQVDRCREITHKLLDFARKKEPLIQAVDMNRLIEDMAKLVEKEARQRNVLIERNYQADLPLVRTDPPLLRQVVLNLLNNANWAIEDRGVITISTMRAGKIAVEFMVSDTGCGIPPENLDKIFDPFFTTKPPGKGTGLGLSICHGIISKLGGSISVDSEVGKGTTFTVHLPAETTKGKN